MNQLHSWASSMVTNGIHCRILLLFCYTFRGIKGLCSLGIWDSISQRKLTERLTSRMITNSWHVKEAHSATSLNIRRKTVSLQTQEALMR